MKTKVFCIGFHKTATTSMGRFLEGLGYRNCHGAGKLRRKMGEQAMMLALFKKDYKLLFELAEEFDSFNDNPWFRIYPELDKHFPGSKFILMTRDETSWLQSCLQYFGTSESAFRLLLYGRGTPVGNEQRYLDIYCKHNLAVQKYFKHRPADFLCVNLEDVNKASKIASFLGFSGPVPSFPHSNQS